MIRRILRSAPNAGDTEFPTTALFVLVRTVHFSPSMATADLNPPTL
jgi:hypothetical protein